MNPRKLDDRGEDVAMNEREGVEQFGAKKGIGLFLGLNLDNLSLNFCWKKLGFITNHKY
jgi:hypothetical protein